jgi:excisionase family DNA binding protein
MNWLSPKTVGGKLDMSAKSVHRMIQRGKLPSVTLPGGKKRVSEEALERFLKKLESKK